MDKGAQPIIIIDPKKEQTKGREALNMNIAAPGHAGRIQIGEARAVADEGARHVAGHEVALAVPPDQRARHVGAGRAVGLRRPRRHHGRALPAYGADHRRPLRPRHIARQQTREIGRAGHRPDHNRRRHRVAHRGDPLVGRQQQRPVGFVVDPDSQVNRAIGEKAWRNRQGHVRHRQVAQVNRE